MRVNSEKSFLILKSTVSLSRKSAKVRRKSTDGDLKFLTLPPDKIIDVCFLEQLPIMARKQPTGYSTSLCTVNILCCRLHTVTNLVVSIS